MMRSTGMTARAEYDAACANVNGTDWKAVADMLARALPKARTPKRGKRAPYRRWHVQWADGWGCVTGAYTWAEECPAEALAWAVGRHTLLAALWEPRHTITAVGEAFEAPCVPAGLECSERDLKFRVADRWARAKLALHTREAEAMRTVEFRASVGRVREFGGEVMADKLRQWEAGERARMAGLAEHLDADEATSVEKFADLCDEYADAARARCGSSHIATEWAALRDRFMARFDDLTGESKRWAPEQNMLAAAE